MNIDTNSFDKRQSVKKNYDLIAEQYSNEFGNYIEDAVVKLVEITKDERTPISHTFTDKHGEFLFGPLCPAKNYGIEIWVNKVDHIKICKTCHKNYNCLKGIKLNCDDCKKCDNYEDKYEEKEHKDYAEEKCNE